MTTRRVAFILLGVVVLSAAAVLFVNRFVVWTIPKMRAEANRFGVPQGMSLISRIEVGDRQCVVACDPPRINLLFRAQNDSKDSCEALQRHLRKLGLERDRKTDPPDVLVPNDTSCFYEVAAPGAGSQAVLIALVLPRRQLNNYLSGGTTPFGLDQDALVAAVVIDSRVD